MSWLNTLGGALKNVFQPPQPGQPQGGNSWIGPAIIAGTSALGGYLANRPQQQQQQQQQTQQQQTTQAGTTQATQTPTFDPLAESMRQRLANVYMNRINESPANLADSIITRNLQNLNRGSEIARKIAANTMAARGLNYSPATGAVLANMGNDRVMRGVDILNSRDALMEDFTRNRLADASSFFRGLPFGQTQTGQTSQTGSLTGQNALTGNTTQSGNQLGGLFGSLATSLAGLYGMRPSQNAPSVRTPGINPYAQLQGQY